MLKDQFLQMSYRRLLHGVTAQSRATGSPECDIGRTTLSTPQPQVPQRHTGTLLC